MSVDPMRCWDDGYEKANGVPCFWRVAGQRFFVPFQMVVRGLPHPLPTLMAVLAGNLTLDGS